jgi:hypothetical protein
VVPVHAPSVVVCFPPSLPSSPSSPPMLCRQALAECVPTSEKTAQEPETGDRASRRRRTNNQFRFQIDSSSNSSFSSVIASSVVLLLLSFIIALASCSRKSSQTLLTNCSSNKSVQTICNTATHYRHVCFLSGANAIILDSFSREEEDDPAARRSGSWYALRH